MKEWFLTQSNCITHSRYTYRRQMTHVKTLVPVWFVSLQNCSSSTPIILAWLVGICHWPFFRINAPFLPQLWLPHLIISPVNLQPLVGYLYRNAQSYWIKLLCCTYISFTWLFTLSKVFLLTPVSLVLVQQSGHSLTLSQVLNIFDVEMLCLLSMSLTDAVWFIFVSI